MLGTYFGCRLLTQQRSHDPQLSVGERWPESLLYPEDELHQANQTATCCLLATNIITIVVSIPNCSLVIIQVASSQIIKNPIFTMIS